MLEVLLRAQAEGSGCVRPWAQLRWGPGARRVPGHTHERGRKSPCVSGVQNLFLFPCALPISFQKEGVERKQALGTSPTLSLHHTQKRRTPPLAGPRNRHWGLDWSDPLIVRLKTLSVRKRLSGTWNRALNSEPGLLWKGPTLLERTPMLTPGSRPLVAPRAPFSYHLGDLPLWLTGQDCWVPLLLLRAPQWVLTPLLASALPGQGQAEWHICSHRSCPSLPPNLHEEVPWSHFLIPRTGVEVGLRWGGAEDGR